MKKLAAAVLATLILAIPVAAQATPGYDSDKNKVSYWCEQGIKFEPVSTPFVVPTPPEGTLWTLIVLKAGTTNESHALPVAGTAYSHSLHENSHVILCYETLVITTTTTTEPPTTTTTANPVTTTTVIDTTTTVPVTTTSSSTTTTALVTTTTESLTSTTFTTTIPPTTTTIPEVVTDLPETGPKHLIPIGLIGALLTTLGAAAIWRMRADNE